MAIKCFLGSATGMWPWANYKILLFFICKSGIIRFYYRQLYRHVTLHSLLCVMKTARLCVYVRVCSVASAVPNSLRPCGGCSLPGSSVHAVLQARIQDWLAMPSSRGFSRPRDWTGVSCDSRITSRFFTTEPLGENFALGYLVTWSCPVTYYPQNPSPKAQPLVVPDLISCSVSLEFCFRFHM